MPEFRTKKCLGRVVFDGSMIHVERYTHVLMDNEIIHAIPTAEIYDMAEPSLALEDGCLIVSGTFSKGSKLVLYAGKDKLKVELAESTIAEELHFHIQSPNDWISVISESAKPILCGKIPVMKIRLEIYETAGEESEEGYVSVPLAIDSFNFTAGKLPELPADVLELVKALIE